MKYLLVSMNKGVKEFDPEYIISVEKVPRINGEEVGNQYVYGDVLYYRFTDECDEVWRKVQFPYRSLFEFSKMKSRELTYFVSNTDLPRHFHFA